MDRIRHSPGPDHARRARCARTRAVLPSAEAVYSGNRWYAHESLYGPIPIRTPPRSCGSKFGGRYRSGHCAQVARDLPPPQRIPVRHRRSGAVSLPRHRRCAWDCRWAWYRYNFCVRYSIRRGRLPVYHQGAPSSIHPICRLIYTSRKSMLALPQTSVPSHISPRSLRTTRSCVNSRTPHAYSPPPKPHSSASSRASCQGGKRMWYVLRWKWRTLLRGRALLQSAGRSAY
jgi:hypothetical protein